MIQWVFESVKINWSLIFILLNLTVLIDHHNHHHTDHPTQCGSFIRKLPLSKLNNPLSTLSGSFLMKLKSRIVLDDPCDGDYDNLLASLSFFEHVEVE